MQGQRTKAQGQKVGLEVQAAGAMVAPLPMSTCDKGSNAES